MKALLLMLLIVCSLNAASKAYFQQRVDTRIEVRLDDSLHFLHGFEHIHYFNNSPDTLHFIYLHLWPNAYGSDETHFSRQQLKNENLTFYFSKQSERGFIDSLNFFVNGNFVQPKSARGFSDIARIDLPNPLLPGAELELTTPFRVKIPEVFSRLGHFKQAYYISQWFPKPAVYDADGWHPMPYADQGEFYSEYGSYDVSITLPKNYIVIATGNCVDSVENAWMDSLGSRGSGSKEPDPWSYQFWKDSINQFPASSNEWKTLHFHEDQVHDFAWFADKRFLLKVDTVTVPTDGITAAHTVKIYAAFLPADEPYWKRSTEYIGTTLKKLSKEVGTYPFKTVKAAEGDLRAGSGMEYPTVTIIDRTAGRSALITTLVHEVGHNWFYGLLGSNERDHAWMDEGLNTFYERRISREIRMSKDSEGRYTSRLEDLLYFDAAAAHTDEALSKTSTEYSKGNYGLDVYYKAAQMLSWLEAWMGADSFKAGMQDYYQTWRFRHPQPSDFRAAMERHTSKNIDWFFDGALNTRTGVDFAVKAPPRKMSNDHLLVRNASDFAAPVRVDAFEQGKLVDSIWVPPFRGDTLVPVARTGKLLWKTGSAIPDYYGLNDNYRADDFLNGKKLKLKFGLRLRRDETADLCLLPGAGYNVYDGFMLGAVLHNLGVPHQRFRFVAAPLYAFGSQSMAGAASVAYWLYPKSVFQEIIPQIDVKSFHFDSSRMNLSSAIYARYLKLAPSLTFEFPRNVQKALDYRRLTVKGYAIWEDQLQFVVQPGDTVESAQLGEKEFLSYGLIRFEQKGRQRVSPYYLNGEAQFGPGFCKLSAEGRYAIPYNKKGQSVYFRGFLGKYIQMNSKGQDPRYWLSSTFSGSNDYLYDGTYIARNGAERFWSRQVSTQEGGGRIAANNYEAFPDNRSDDWLIALNIKSDIPYLPLPIRVYADVSSRGVGEQLAQGQSRYLYSAGLEFHALNDVILLHVPILLESGYRDFLNQQDPENVFWNSISFSLQLQNINWLRSVSTVTKFLLK